MTYPMKKTISLLLTTILALSLDGCGGQTANLNAPTASQSVSQETPGTANGKPETGKADRQESSAPEEAQNTQISAAAETQALSEEELAV